MNRGERIAKFSVGLYPPFLVRVQGLFRLLALDWMPYSGLRDMVEQARLYAEGRSTAGKIVTNAQAGDSSHNYGCGLDATLFDSNGQPIYDHNRWGELQDSARLCGLRSGATFARFIDRPHLELPISLRYTQVGDVYRASGLSAAMALIQKSTIR